ncbi:MAG: hypothetical protein KIG88_07785, partial [Weeksellaceae bacterium]|nr:hypothetical protein [Weeksellaceae bacterium]
MKKYIILAISLLNYSHLFSQNYKINWENNKDYTLTNGQKIKVPFFDNSTEYSLNEYYTPNFNIVLNERVDHVEIINPVTSPLTTAELVQFRAFEIVAEKISFSRQNYFDNNVQKTLISVFPYVKKGNSIHKLLSFDIKKSTNSNKSLVQSRIFSDDRSSVLKEGNWFKIKVDKTGVFKLNKSFFTTHGIPTSGYNLSSLKIYGNGNGRMMENASEFRYGSLQEIPIEFLGSEDNSFDANDYITFYAKGPHQWYRQNESSLADVFLRYNIY